jgi:protein phosphatase
MGGHVGGALASRVVCTALLERWEVHSRTADRASLLPIVNEANDRLADHAAANPDLAGMGCTLLAVELRDDGRAYRWLSVGDSPLISVVGDRVVRLNQDHSFRAEADAAKAAGLPASEIPSRNMLRSALSGGHIPMVDDHTAWQTFRTDEILILASDGIETLDLAEIAEVARRAESAQALASSLIAAVAAKDLPKQDNTSVAVFKPSPAPGMGRLSRGRHTWAAWAVVATLLVLIAAWLWHPFPPHDLVSSDTRQAGMAPDEMAKPR